MRWRTVNHTLIESDAGYRVMRCTTDGVPIDWYIAFRGKTVRATGEMPLILGGWPSAEDAKRCCEAHWAKYSEAAA